jgi:hypothetical protein
MIKQIAVPAKPPIGREQDWVGLARAVANEAAGSGHGGHERIYEERAKSLGLHVQSIKRALTAFKFVSQVASRDVGKARRLMAMPVAAVLAVSRWYSYDRDAAFDAMERCEAGHLSARQLDAKEKKARRLHAEFVASASQNRLSYELDALDAAHAHLLPDWLTESSGPFDGLGDGPFARIFRHRQHGHLCLLLVPGPFESQGEWHRKQNEIMLSALGATALGHRVLIVVPAHSGVRELLLAWKERLCPLETNISILEMRLRGSEASALAVD